MAIPPLQLRTGGLSASPPISSPAASGRLGGLALGVAVLGSLACGPSADNRPAPSPALASSARAEAEFRILLRQWGDLPPEDRGQLEPKLQQFAERFPKDPLARRAGAYLAWLMLDRGRLDAAAELVSRLRYGPRGVVLDFVRVVYARTLLLKGESRKALASLLPIRGKIIDEHDRFLLNLTLARAAMAAGELDLGREVLLDWLEYSAVDLAQSEVDALIASMSLEELESGLRAFDLPETAMGKRRAAARVWLRKKIRQRLTEAALRDQNRGLAQRLVRSALPRLQRNSEEEALYHLAKEVNESPRISGRTLGLLLTHSDPRGRVASAELAIGVSWALRLPRAEANGDAVELLVRDDRGDPGRLEVALSGLAGDGAAVLLAGATPVEAGRAARFAEERQIPVILFSLPDPPLPNSRYSFSLVGDTPTAVGRLRDALGVNDSAKVIHVGGPDMSCSRQAEAAGLTRFPTAAWRARGVSALLLSGGPRCSRDVLRESAALGQPLDLAVGFGAVHETYPDLGGTLWEIGAGVFPARRAQSKPPRLQEFLNEKQREPTWNEALGYDAGVLAERALMTLPREGVQDEQAVRKLHRRARGALASASASLWTSTAPGFEGRSQIVRKLIVHSSQPGKRPAP